MRSRALGGGGDDDKNTSDDLVEGRAVHHDVVSRPGDTADWRKDAQGSRGGG